MAGKWRNAGLHPRLATILDYAERLTLSPASIGAADIGSLRDAGLTDEAILHVAEITSYFNFVNRMADGLGVPLEETWSETIIGRDG